MADSNDHQDNSPTNNTGNRRFKTLEHSLFPDNNADYASSFMGGQGHENELIGPASPSTPPPWEDPDEAWRYDGNNVWDGEAWVYSTRPQVVSSTATGMLTSGVPQGAIAGPHAQNVSANDVYAGFGSSAPPNRTTNNSSPPQEVTEWNSADILRLYKWKIVKKKGYPVILKEFPGQTIASLDAAWKEHRPEGKRLYEEEQARGD